MTKDASARASAGYEFALVPATGLPVLAAVMVGIAFVSREPLWLLSAATAFGLVLPWITELDLSSTHGMALTLACLASAGASLGCLASLVASGARVLDHQVPIEPLATLGALAAYGASTRRSRHR